MPPKSKKTSGRGGGEAAHISVRGAAPDAGVQAGRKSGFHTRTFEQRESNFFLFRTWFLYVFFGIEGIGTMFPRGRGMITIDTLLIKTGVIEDEEVKKMIWVVCNLETYLNDSSDEETVDSFIERFNGAYIGTTGIYPIPSIEVIAKSIATLVVRVFIAFQNRINGLKPQAVVPGKAEMKEVEAEMKEMKEVEATMKSYIDNPGIIPEILGELIKEPAQEDDDVKKNATQKKSELDRKIHNIIPKGVAVAEDTSSSRRSGRVRASNEAIAAAAAARAQAKEAQRKQEQEAKQGIIAKELEKLKECMESFGKLTKFIPSIPGECLAQSDKVSVTFDVPKFYKSLPLAFSRIRSCIERRLTHEDVKPGPGTADTMNALGLLDPSVKTTDGDGDGDGGQGDKGGKGGKGGKAELGGNAELGGARRIGITKRKTNNKIIIKLKSKLKKHSQKIFYGGAGGVMLRGFGEHTQPIPQCDSTIDNYNKYERPSCYICGEPWIEGLQSSMECEHILCVIHAIEYYGLLQTVYLDQEQKDFLSNLYAWAHRCCNQRKRNTAFIRKNPNPGVAARGNHFIPDDMNIRELLADIHTLSKYTDTDPKHKLDCNKILKQGKYRDKKHFVDARTIVVTKYVTPLIDSINTVFTGLFQASMVLFNAVGCLKILSEFTIYLTGSKKAESLKLQLGKTAEFMDEVVFPGCSIKVQGGGGRRIFHDKKTRKSLRRKIQRGGAKNFITDFFTGQVAQEEYETEIRKFKDDISIQQVSTLNSDLNKLRDPSPNVDQFGTPLTPVNTTKMDVILFILFILNHSRNPTILLGLFLDLNPTLPAAAYITSELADYNKEEPVPSGQRDLSPESLTANLKQSYDVYVSKRIPKQNAFIEIFTRVVNNADLFNSVIIPYLTSCDMLPSFLGVVTFCRRQEFITTHIPQLGSNLDVITPGLFGSVQSSLPVVNTFAAKVTDFNKHLQGDSMLFASEVAIPNTPLDHLVNACFHLKQYGGDDTRGVLLEACCLFPSCFDDEAADIFSKFGPCNAYNSGVLKNEPFQKMLGCVASAKEMCTIIAHKRLVQHDSLRSTEQDIAFNLFKDFFVKDDRILLAVATQGLSAASAAADATPPLAPFSTTTYQPHWVNERAVVSNFDEDIYYHDPKGEKRRLSIAKGLTQLKHYEIQNNKPQQQHSLQQMSQVLQQSMKQKAHMLLLRQVLEQQQQQQQHQVLQQQPHPHQFPPRAPRALNTMCLSPPPSSGSYGLPMNHDSFDSVSSGSPGSPVSPGSSVSPGSGWRNWVPWSSWLPGGGSSTRTRRRRNLHRNHRRTQYTNKHKRSSKTTKHSTIKHRKSYRKHNRTIKRRKSRRHR